jgi:glucosamine--fructose-6-phosphate aminotransferase (isomerizing)
MATVTAATHFLEDILRQPDEVSRTIEYLTGPGRNALQQSSSIIQSGRDIFLTGIGASWHATLGAGSLLQGAGRPVHMQEASELLHCTTIPRGSVIVILSRTGRSIEIVHLLEKARLSNAAVIGITNSEDSPLARESRITIAVPAKLDHAISVNTYSTLLIAAGALAWSTFDSFLPIAPSLLKAVREAEQSLSVWQRQVEQSGWFVGGAPYYFLARGGSLGSCHEARLLWEEGAKMPATAMSTGGFRHGPQEIVREGLRFCIWIDQSRMRDQDLSVAYDLRELGASVMLIGENLPPDAGDLVCQLPTSPANWQFAVDVFPIQLAAERMSRLLGVDCDSFRLCSYVVEDEHGLLHKKAEVSQDAE